MPLPKTSRSYARFQAPAEAMNPVENGPELAGDSTFERDSNIDDLIKDVQLGASLTVVVPAVTIVAATNALGQNQLFDVALRYVDISADQDTLFQARSTKASSGMELLVHEAPPGIIPF